MAPIGIDVAVECRIAALIGRAEDKARGLVELNHVAARHQTIELIPARSTWYLRRRRVGRCRTRRRWRTHLIAIAVEQRHGDVVDAGLTHTLIQHVLNAVAVEVVPQRVTDRNGAEEAGIDGQVAFPCVEADRVGAAVRIGVAVVCGRAVGCVLRRIARRRVIAAVERVGRIRGELHTVLAGNQIGEEVEAIGVSRCGGHNVPRAVTLSQLHEARLECRLLVRSRRRLRRPECRLPLQSSQTKSPMVARRRGRRHREPGRSPTRARPAGSQCSRGSAENRLHCELEVAPAGITIAKSRVSHSGPSLSSKDVIELRSHTANGDKRPGRGDWPVTLPKNRSSFAVAGAVRCGKRKGLRNGALLRLRGTDKG